jgi:hypothetical protein
LVDPTAGLDVLEEKEAFSLPGFEPRVVQAVNFEN